ncbi:MAG TPA: hypothetical protein VD788_11480, partial [Candidatus Polarisedimenticolaceae bacterium]|nr:hypothetical protein [Candidatus Polarisedimenticolaceae bacterium]
GQNAACGTARRFQIEESWQTDKSLRLLSLTLGQLAGLDPPKVVFYFADMMRQQAGAHFFSYIGSCSLTADDGVGRQSGFGAEFAIDSVIEQAASYGTRVYAVRGEGLVASSTSSRRMAFDNVAATNQQRYAHAGDSLAGLSIETGGRSFIHGETPAKIVQAVEQDMGCLYLVSFDPAGLPLDVPLSVSVEPRSRGVKIHTRGRIVIQSDRTRQISELMAAFASPRAGSADAPIFGAVIPTGFADGRYDALVQLRVPGSPLARAEWHLGASLLTRGELNDNVSAQIALDRPGVPAVFETQLGFRPGPYELILVAHDAVADQIGADRLEGGWPLRDEGPVVGPIAIMQPASGAFVRDGEVRTHGALGLTEREPLRAAVPTAFVGLVCRGPEKGRLLVHRSLSGMTEHPFPEMEVDLEVERCAQIRDLIPEGTMTPGRFAYRVRLLRDERTVAEGERSFDVVGVQETAPSATEGSDE